MDNPFFEKLILLPITQRFPDNAAVENSLKPDYIYQHIRPLAVSPLNHPERVPIPWGFLFSGIGYPVFQRRSRKLWS